MLLKRWSVRARAGDHALQASLAGRAAIGLIALVLTMSLAAVDWVMSLNPHWYSTIFGVYVFAGSVVSALAVLSLVTVGLQQSGYFRRVATVEHRHDVGKLLFGFTVFWAYIAFSQFLLIWYANIPEETFWYKYRFWDPVWGKASWALLIFHLIIPFLGLMARTVRRNKTYLLFATIYVLCIHWYDHFYIVMPQYGYSIEGAPLAGKPGFAFSWLIDVPCAIGMIGLYVALFALIAGDRPLLPKQDPRLGESLNHVNP